MTNRKERDLKLLHDFRQNLLDWRKAHSADKRTVINRQLPQIKKILDITCTTKYVSIQAPPMFGGQTVISKGNALDLIFNAPYNIDIVPTIIDAIDSAIGVLSNSDFSYPEHEKGSLQKKPINLKKVFIVHGHDEELKEKVARFLEKADISPIILHEQPNNGQTIIEKFERNANDVGFAIILITPDDEGHAINEKRINKRARQNVILELGYFIGTLGRKHVIAIKKGDIELPSDIMGVIWTDASNDDSWQIKLAKELYSAGYDIDLNILL